MKPKITVSYWHGHQFPDLVYKHQEEFSYASDDQLLGMINYILSKKYSIMLRPQENGDIIMWIDNGRFGQK